MPDKTGTAVLRGFNMVASDVGDRLCFCQPVLSFKGDSTLYVARKLDWRNDQKALAITDLDEVNELGTSLPNTKQSIAPGEGVVVGGAEFVQAAADAGVQLDHTEISFLSLDDAKCWVGVATPECFKDLRKKLTEEARTVFDETLGAAARHERPISERGNAALLLLRRCAPRRLDDLAIRQLAGALQNRELDLYRRLLIRFAHELKTQEDDLDERARRHIELATSPWRISSYLPPEQEYKWNHLQSDKVSIFMTCLPSISLHKPQAYGESGNSWNEVYLKNKGFEELNLIYRITKSTPTIIDDSKKHGIYGKQKMIFPWSKLTTFLFPNKSIMDTMKDLEVG